MLVGLGAVLLLAATLILAPLAARPAASALGAVLGATRGLPGRLARDNAIRNPRRTASTATALVVGVAVVSLFTVFAASLRTGIDDEVSAGFGDADLVLATPIFGGGELSATAAQEIAELPETAAAVGVGTAPVRLGDSNELVAVTDLAAIGEVLDVDVVDGELAGAAPTDVAISESWAEREGLGVGSSVDVTFADGATEALTVAAVYADQQILGGFLLGQDIRAEHTSQPTDRAVFMTTSPGVSPDAGPRGARPDRRRATAATSRTVPSTPQRSPGDSTCCSASSTPCSPWRSSSPCSASPTRCRWRSTSGGGRSACCGPWARPAATPARRCAWSR